MTLPASLTTSYILSIHLRFCLYSLFFFFNDTATTEIYTLSLHDALPISQILAEFPDVVYIVLGATHPNELRDRKSTRLNSSHGYISYAVFCLKKKKKHRSTAMMLQYDQTAYTPLRETT